MFLTDEPIQSIDDDSLGRTTFAKEFAKSLLARKTKESIVVGFDGPWGSGKSSVLNLLQQNITLMDENIETIFIRFDPWYFNSTEQLINTFFEGINALLSHKVKSGNLTNLLSKYRKVLSSVQLAPKVSFFGVELSLGNVDIKLDNPEKLREEIKKTVATANTRVIVLIDNLDRLDISELLLMFKLVRLCSDFPGFIFVLAFDKQQVLRLFDENNIPHDYLEKIVQVDVKLPAIESGKIDDFVMGGIKWIAENRKFQLSDFFWANFLQIYRTEIGPRLIITLRDAKRFLNTIDFSITLVKGEVEYSDFFVLQVVRVFFPDLYERVPEYKDVLAKQDILIGTDWRRREIIGTFNTLDKWITDHYKDQANTVKALLAFLFPKFKAYSQNPQNPVFIQNYKESENLQLISSPTHFDRYFTLKVADNDIPTTMISDFISRLNEHQEADLIKDQFLKRYQDENRLITAVKKVYVYSEKLNPEAKILLIDVLAGNSLMYSGTTHSWDSEFSEVIRLLNVLIPSLEEDVQTELMSQIINTTPSLPFAIRITQDCIKAPWYSFDDERKGIFLESCRTRVHNEILNNDRTIFDLFPDQYSGILGAWKSSEFLNETTIVNDYLESVFQKIPSFVTKILSMYVWVAAGTNKPSHFGYSDFVKEYDPQKIKGHLDNADLSAVALSEGEAFAVREFLNLYAEHTRQNNNA